HAERLGLLAIHVHAQLLRGRVVGGGDLAQLRPCPRLRQEFLYLLRDLRAGRLALALHVHFQAASRSQARYGRWITGRMIPSRTCEKFLNASRMTALEFCVRMFSFE